MDGKSGYQPLQNPHQPPPPAYGTQQPQYYGQNAYQPSAVPPAYPQATHNNVVVVQQQPVVTGVVRTTYAGDNFLTLSIVLTVMCFIFGLWPALLCTIPAIIFSTAARDAQVRGDLDDARRNRNISLCLNIFGSIFWIVAYVATIIAVVVTITANASSCYYDYNYNTYYYYCY